jgi:hypothetical protein
MSRPQTRRAGAASACIGWTDETKKTGAYAKLSAQGLAVSLAMSGPPLSLRRRRQQRFANEDDVPKAAELRAVG